MLVHGSATAGGSCFAGHLSDALVLPTYERELCAMARKLKRPGLAYPARCPS